MEKLPLTILILVFALTGSAADKDGSDKHEPVEGPISPAPVGCIHLEFYKLTDDSHCQRNADGEISTIITPIGRKEPLLKQWKLEELEKALADREKSDQRPYLPGEAAWREASKHVRPGDKIWTFGHLDTGVAIIRDGKLFCQIVVDHQF